MRLAGGQHVVNFVHASLECALRTFKVWHESRCDQSVDPKRLARELEGVAKLRNHGGRHERGDLYLPNASVHVIAAPFELMLGRDERLHELQPIPKTDFAYRYAWTHGLKSLRSKFSTTVPFPARAGRHRRVPCWWKLGQSGRGGFRDICPCCRIPSTFAPFGSPPR